MYVIDVVLCRLFLGNTADTKSKSSGDNGPAGQSEQTHHKLKPNKSNRGKIPLSKQVGVFFVNILYITLIFAKIMTYYQTALATPP